MAPTSLSIPVERQKRHIKQDIKSRTVELGSEAVVDASMQEYGPTQLAETLNTRADHRDPAAVRIALEWWLKSLPISGFQLAPELCAENWTLFETFFSGKLATCNKGQVIQEEGEEVKHYSLILFGQCKLRCAKPAVGIAPVVPTLDNSTHDADAREADTFINIEALGRGESIGLYPGEQRSPYNIICTEKTTLLRLTAQDYEATLRPYHQEFFARTVDFLEKNGVFPEVGTSQLKKVAPLLRQRRVPRGQVFVRIGQCQRHVYFLREGSCSVLVHDSPDGVGGTVPLDEEEAEEDEDAEDHDSFLKMRSTSYGPRMQQQAAYDEKRRDVVKGMARGPLRKTLAGGSRTAFKVSDGDVHASATLSEPGVSLGEEALVHDNLREWVNVRNCYTVRAAKNCSFFVADITAFKTLASYMGSGETTQMVSEKLTRRCKQFTRARNATQKINKRAQEMKASEFAKQSRQQLRLPQCAGYPAVDELENVDDYLDVILEHRKPPPNLTQLPTLACLEGTAYGPKSNANGPGVTAMLKAMEDGAPRRRSSFQWRDSSSYDENPMGSSVPADAKYAETDPYAHSHEIEVFVEQCGAPSPKALTRGESQPELSTGWGGVFLNTEVNFDDGMTVSLQSQTMATSSSLPNLRHTKKVEKVEKPAENVATVAETSPKAPSRTDAKSQVAKRQQRVIKTFKRVMVGKTVLVLTDKPDLRKQITRVLVADDTSLVFIKSTNDLWHRLRDPKEEYDVLLLDLTKSELQVEPLLRAIRQHTRYADLQIVVLSQEHELPEVVRNCCSFAVFFPLAATMLREAMVWCFDRKSGQVLFPGESQQEWDGVRGRAPPGAPPLALSETPVVAVN